MANTETVNTNTNIETDIDGSPDGAYTAWHITTTSGGLITLGNDRHDLDLTADVVNAFSIPRLRGILSDLHDDGIETLTTAEVLGLFEYCTVVGNEIAKIYNDRKIRWGGFV